MTERLDIFRVLNAANEKNREFFPRLSEDEVKSFQPFLVMRWMTGTSDARQVLFVNELVNPYAFSLQRHKHLLWSLLVISNSGRKTRYKWLKQPSKKDPSRPVSTQVVMDYFRYSSRDAIEALRLLDLEDVIEMAEHLGLQQEDIAKIKREAKGGSSEKATKAAKKTAADDLFEY